MEANPKIIRVFISSTFRDMHAERDYLARFVFPELRSRCQLRGAEFVGLDLRWGVTQEDAERVGALAICLDEIERRRPFFVGLLGQRYGWVPPPEEIPAELFESSVLSSSADSEARKWYALDDTSSPALYRLRHDSRIDAETTEELARYWEARGLPLAGKSITALEILRGVFDEGYPSTHGLFYFRMPGLETDAQIPQWLQSVLIEPDNELGDKLQQLKDRIRSEGRFSVREYATRFAGIRIDPNIVPPDLAAADQEVLGSGVVPPETWRTLSPELQHLLEERGTAALEGLEEFGNQVLEDLWHAIEAELGRAKELPDSHEQQRAYHDRFVAERSRNFIGRENIVGEVITHLETEGRSRPLVVAGPAGCGKSALLARCVEAYRNRSPGSLVIPYFLGAAPDSTDTDSILRWVWEALARNGIVRDAAPTDLQQLKHRIGDILKSGTRHRPVVLFFDAVDRLVTPQQFGRLSWLPTMLPPGLRIVISVLPGADLERLRERLPEVPELVEADLARRRKKLSADQLELLLDTESHPDAMLPLYLSVAVEELSLYGDFESLTDRIKRLPPSVAELFDQVLARLDQDHGNTLTGSVCGWLAASRSGLHEPEVLDLLASDGPEFPKARWTRLYRSLMFYLQPIDESSGAGRLDFNHEQLEQAVMRRYLDMPATEPAPSAEFVESHSELGRYFERQSHTGAGNWRADRSRGLAELPFHLANSRQWSKVTETLSDLGFVEAKTEVGLLSGLIQDYSYTLSLMRASNPAWLDTSGLREIGQFVRSQSMILAQAPQLVFQSAANQPDGSRPNRLAMERLAARSELRPWFRWNNKPEVRADVELTLKGKLKSAYSCAVSPDSQIVAIGGWGGVELWSVLTGEKLTEIAATDAVAQLAYAPEGLWMACGQFVSSPRALNLVDPESGEIQHQRVVESPGLRVAISQDGKLLGLLGQDGEVRIVDHESTVVLNRLEIADAECLGFSGDGKVLAVASTSGRIETYDTGTWSATRRIDSGMAVDGISLSQDGKTIALLRQDLIAFFDLSSSALLGMIESKSSAFENCAFAPAGGWVTVIARDGTLEMWSPCWLADRRDTIEQTPLPARLRKLPPEWRESAKRRNQTMAPVVGCAFDPSGSTVFVTRPGLEVAIYAPNPFERIEVLLELDIKTPKPSTFGLAPDSTYYAVGTSDGRLGLFSTNSPQYLPKYLPAHNATITTCAFSPDSKMIATASDDHSIAIWDVAGQVKLQLLKGHTAPVRDCCWLGDGTTLISVSADRSVRFWDGRTGALIKSLEMLAAATCCSHNDDRSEVIIGDSRGGLSRLDITSAEQRSTQMLHQDSVVMCSWINGASRVFSAASGGSAKVLDLVTAETMATLLLPAPITAAAIHAPSRCCIICAADGSIMSLSLEQLEMVNDQGAMNETNT